MFQHNMLSTNCYNNKGIELIIDIKLFFCIYKFTKLHGISFFVATLLWTYSLQWRKQQVGIETLHSENNISNQQHIVISHANNIFLFANLIILSFAYSNFIHVKNATYFYLNKVIFFSQSLLKRFDGIYTILQQIIYFHNTLIPRTQV